MRKSETEKQLGSWTLIQLKLKISLVFVSIKNELYRRLLSPFFFSCFWCCWLLMSSPLCHIAFSVFWLTLMLSFLLEGICILPKQFLGSFLWLFDTSTFISSQRIAMDNFTSFMGFVMKYFTLLALMRRNNLGN